MALPSLNEHDGQAKLEPLREPVHPGPAIASWLERISTDRDPSTLRVLDVGCGRGGAVAWLLERGYDAYGIDVRPEYIANGRPYVGAERLAVLNGSRYPYADNYFDIVLSDQVLEHVENLEQLTDEVARTTRMGGVGLHVFPAKWILTEPHLLAPMVHWLPKGDLRRRAIKLALNRGFAAPYFADRTLEERTQIFYEYSVNETFYRQPASIRRIFETAGLSADYKEESLYQLLAKLGMSRLPSPLDRPAAWAYRSTRMMYLTTEKRSE